MISISAFQFPCRVHTDSRLLYLYTNGSQESWWKIRGSHLCLTFVWKTKLFLSTVFLLLISAWVKLNCTKLNCKLTPSTAILIDSLQIKMRTLFLCSPDSIKKNKPQIPFDGFMTPPITVFEYIAINEVFTEQNSTWGKEALALFTEIQNMGKTVMWEKSLKWTGDMWEEISGTKSHQYRVWPSCVSVMDHPHKYPKLESAQSQDGLIENRQIYMWNTPNQRPGQKNPERGETVNFAI